MLLYRDRRNGKVQLTAVADRAEFRELPSGPGHWRAAALNSKGHTAAIGNYDGHLLLYDYDAGKTTLDIPNAGSAITQVEFSADRRLVATLLHPTACLQPKANTGEYSLSENCPQRSTVMVWDAQTGKSFYSATMERVFSIALAENGQNIALGLLNQVRIVNMLRKTTVWTLGLDLDDSEAEPFEPRFVQVALSPDGCHLPSSAIGPVRIFDLSNGRIVHSLADPPQAFAGNSVLTSSGSVLMAQSHPKRIVVTELSPGASTRVLERCPSAVR
jgi:WD40 repeat protein